MNYFKTYLFILALVLLVPFYSNGQLFEAEDATLSNGATVASSGEASGGKYVKLGEGNLEMTITLKNSGTYNIYMQVAAPYGEKTNIFEIDGNSVEFKLAENSNYIKKEIVSNLKLEAGEHTIKVIKSWGWIHIDYFDLETVDATERFDVSDSLVTPGATSQAQKLYQFLLNNYGKKIISGVMTLNSMDEVDWLETKTGKKPALVGLDFMHLGRDYEWYNENEPIIDARNYYNQNGIPAIAWHWRDPSRETESFYSDETDFDITKINNPESEEYKAMIDDIDYISGFLKQLQEDSVAVLWRPLHEAAGGWFWWGANGPQACKKLYHTMFNRLVHHHNIRNLIWVWTRQPNDDEWYPGHEYVDIIGRDIYADGNHSSQIIEFNAINSLYEGKKIVALSECGSFPDPDKLVEDGAAWSFFMPWYGDFVRDSYYNSVELWQKTMDHEYVITLDEMPDLRSYGDTVDDDTSTDIIDMANLNVYPNIVSGSLNISSDSSIGEIRIFNSMGKLIETKKTHSNYLQINMADYFKGIYLIKPENNRLFKVIKQ
ncbi:MAG TPA: glycosyl hydrolase [Prolixibacteraceae bacterium]|nr:glycosyl hydrolase [Prolixibacteraceae bacterium]